MTDAAQAQPRNNGFGFLRLLFASLVIVSHVPELVDGDRHRELLSRLTGTTSFGEFAVNGFFVISGFLISGSLDASRSTRAYLLKRVGRLYPAFIIASLLCLLVVAPVAGGTSPDGPRRTMLLAVARIAILARPMVSNAFAGQHDADPGAALDGVIWTVQYEFACYLLVIVLALLGWLNRPVVLAGLALALLATALVLPPALLDRFGPADLFPGPLSALLRLPAMFMAGAAFRVAPPLPFDRRGVIVAAVGLTAMLTIPALAPLGFATFGAYLIFATATLGSGTWLARINNRTDISYGLYLYAWPVQRLLMLGGVTALLPLGLATWVIAAACGLLSWLVVEQPAMAWAHRLARRSQVAVAARPPQ